MTPDTGPSDEQIIEEMHYAFVEGSASVVNHMAGAAMAFAIAERHLRERHAEIAKAEATKCENEAKTCSTTWDVTALMMCSSTALAISAAIRQEQTK